MYPTLFTIPFFPEGWGDVKSYGFMMMIAFLSGIWLAARRAMRVQADPDLVLNLGLIALVTGVAGARIFFVWHYWEDQFATQINPIWAAMRIDRGGLEFWGGPILGIPCMALYLWWKKASIRWYMDILAPSLMWGLAITRIGCFLNGCCWGGVCVDPNDRVNAAAGLPWAMRFPYASPAMAQQYQFRQMTLPKELQYTLPNGQTVPLPREYLEMSRAELDGPRRDLERAESELTLLKRMGADAEEIKKKEVTAEKARETLKTHEQVLLPLNQVMSRTGLDHSQLTELVGHYRSLPVHPTQLYSMVNAFFLSWILSVLFYRRRRHGVVAGWMVVLYSGTRILLECVRQDNPLDVAHLTISQSVSLGIIVLAGLYFWRILRMPERSPLAIPFVFPEDEDPPRPMARPASG
ncbi:MAG: prolipoprotein diacylglyceryl transferase family protein [Phycisphaerae bacterium]